MKTHCAVCHTDRANNGGLSLEGFDASVAAPSLAAMMLSKITSGTALATVNAAGHDAAAAATLETRHGKGAVSAAGIGVPDKSTVDGLVAAFAAQSAGAAKWSVERGKASSDRRGARHRQHRAGAAVVAAAGRPATSRPRCTAWC